jgi:hypothetical protein
MSTQGSEPTTIPEFTDEQMLEQFDDYVKHGVIDYILPTTPLGEEWIVGLTDNNGNPNIAKMNSEQAFGFLIGVSVMIRFMARRAGMTL